MNVAFKKKVPSHEWLLYRFDIFKKFCYPSIMNQLNKNFKWIVVFDDSTDRNVSESLPGYIPLYIKRTFESSSETGEFVNSLVSKNTEYLITTRVDSDDCLSDKYISTVQEYLLSRSNDNVAVHYKNGFKYNTVTNSWTKHAYPSISGFLSSIENRKPNIPFTTVYGNRKGHQSVHKTFDVVNVNNTIPMYIQIIHGKNDSSRHSGEHINPDSYKKDIDTFHINI
jgi:hypothetical protein